MGVAGGSGSGKTTFARAVLEQSRAAGISGQMFSLDNYYRPLGHLSLEERKAYNFDHPHAIDFELALEQLRFHCEQIRLGQARFLACLCLAQARLQILPQCDQLRLHRVKVPLRLETAPLDARLCRLDMLFHFRPQASAQVRDFL